MAPSSSIAAIASAGYIGLFTGPPLLGLVADTVGLSGAIGLVVGLGGLVAAATGPVLHRSDAA